MENLVSGDIKVEDVSIEELKKMVHNILPNGQTMLHILARKPAVLRQILEMTEEDGPLADCDIPLMLDMDNNSALDILLQKRDLNTIDQILSYMSRQGIDHHSRALQKTLPNMIRNNV